MARSTIFTGLLVVLAGLILAGIWLYTPDKSRGELERDYLRSTEDYISLGELRLHVRDDGPQAAPAIIFLHGFGSSLHTWEEWASALSARWRVVRLDLTGFGLTGPDPSGDYSDTRSIDVLIRLMDRLNIARAVMVGNSMGGRIAWRLAARHPERVSGLVLISPDGFASDGRDYDRKAEVPGIIGIFKHVLPRWLMRANIEPAFAQPEALSEALLDRYHDMILAPGVRGAVIARLEQVMLVRPEPLLRTITAPTLLLWGVEDRLIPIGNAADYLEEMPNAMLVRLPGIGHVPQEEAPEASLAPVRAFLGRINGAMPDPG